MQQFEGGVYCFCNQSRQFKVEEADRFFFICRYHGSNEGFVMEKEVFCRQVNRGRIIEQQLNTLAV